jgi:hypothetical protein
LYRSGSIIALGDYSPHIHHPPFESAGSKKACKVFNHDAVLDFEDEASSILVDRLKTCERADGTSALYHPK